MNYLKKKIWFICWLILLTPLIVFSQGEGNTWYFGNNAGLDFSTSTVSPLNNSMHTIGEGSATISDTSGNLLFYTDGTKVWNKNHQVMPNGNGLLGDNSSTQSAIIVPHPGNPNLYYVFTTMANYHLIASEGLNYSIVDMTLDNGNGDIISSSKNIELLNIVDEKLTAIKTNNEYWVLARYDDTFYAYTINNSGINTTPVTSVLSPDLVDTATNTFGYNSAVGQMKFSPDGTKLAVAYFDFVYGVTYPGAVYLYDFDSVTGIITNPLHITDIIDPYGIEFSPNSSKLYLTTGFFRVTQNSQNGFLYQFDLDAIDISQSQILITQLPQNVFFGALQLAVDGNIYVPKVLVNPNTLLITGSDYISRIENSNEISSNINFNEDAIHLNGGQCNFGLPTFIQSFFNVGIVIENSCFGDTTEFQLTISESYDSIQWDFGDGNSSSLDNPSHTYTSAGTYTVSAIVTSGTSTISNSTQITIYEQPVANQAMNMTACDDNNDGFFEFDLTTQETVILNGQDNSIFDIKYYASMIDYSNSNAIVNPQTYINTDPYASQTIVASIYNIDNNECEAVTTFTIQVYESPILNTNLPNITECDNISVGTDTDGIVVFDLTQNESIILGGQSASSFTISYYTDSSFINEISTPSAYQNTNSIETIYVLVENNNFVSSCIANTSFTLEVYTLPIINSLVELKQCDNDLDGFSVFNLSEVIGEITTNATNETITFYESLTNAQNQNFPIVDIFFYTNQTVSTDTVWARIENTNGCFRTSQINLIISTTQIPNSFTRDFYQCDDGIDAYDGIATFDFSSVNNDIQALFPTGQQLIISYYTNQADALSEINPITDITNYHNISSPNMQDIYIRVDSALDNDCLGLGHHITLHVEAIPVANTVIVPDECDANGDGMFEFETSTIETVLLSGQTNVNVTYTDQNGSPLPSPLPNPFITASQTITARVTNTISQGIDSACFDETTIVFNVETSAVANPISTMFTCDDDADGIADFDTSTIETSLLNGQTGMLVNYTDQIGNTLPSPLPNPFSTTSQIITVRVENMLNSSCFEETTIEFVVYEIPTAFPIQDDFVCDDISNDGQAIFTLSNYNPQVLNGQSNSIFEVQYFVNLTEAENNINPLPNNYVVSTSSEEVFVRVHNINSPSCYAVTSFQLGVVYLPIAEQPNDIYSCDGVENDGIEVFDLTDQNMAILGTQSDIENTITYHLSQSDADNSSSPLDTLFTNTSNPQTIYVRLENNNHPECYTTTSFSLNVIEQPILLIDDSWAICEYESIQIIADEGYDEYLWSTGETTPLINVDQAGIYQLNVANTQGGIRCETSKTITVIESSIATITNIETTDWTQYQNTITVHVEGSGDYEYSIDGINYQDENVFSNLIIEEYNVTVRDKNGCGIISEEVFLLYYPNFFTPNGDGYNDNWQLINSNKEPKNKVYIFDRYGKLIKELHPNDVGWDGTFNGTPMPSADYWFLLERQNGKKITGHFSLRR